MVYSKKSEKTRVQSVLFDRNQWTVSKAKSWLKQHNFRSDDIDKKPLHIRCRQISPAYLKGKGYVFRTKLLPHGIAFIIAFKKRKRRVKI